MFDVKAATRANLNWNRMPLSPDYMVPIDEQPEGVELPTQYSISRNYRWGAIFSRAYIAKEPGVGGGVPSIMCDNYPRICVRLGPTIGM